MTNTVVTDADYRWAANLAASLVVEANGLEKDVARQIGRLALWRAAQRYDAAVGSTLRQYAKERVKGAAMDYIREIATRPDRDGLSDAEEASGHDLATEARIDVERALGGMDERHAQVLRLTYIEGHSQRETGRLMGVSEGRIGQLKTEALRAARR